MNLVDMMLQFIICNLFILRLFLDQGLNIFIQTYYNEIGKENAFNIWWLGFYLEDIGTTKKTVLELFYHFFRIKVPLGSQGLL